MQTNVILKTTKKGCFTHLYQRYKKHSTHAPHELRHPLTFTFGKPAHA